MIIKAIKTCRIAIITFFAFLGAQSSMADIGDAEAVKNVPHSYCNAGEKLVIKDDFMMTRFYSFDGDKFIGCKFLPKMDTGEEIGFGYDRIEVIQNCKSSVECAKKFTRSAFGYKASRKISEKIVAGHTFFCAIRNTKNMVHEYCNSFFNERRVWLDLKSPEISYTTDKLSKIFIEIE